MVPEEKHLERENVGERWALVLQAILSALAVEEAHILSDIISGSSLFLLD